MIYVIAIILIVVLILIALLVNQQSKIKELREKHWNEVRISSDLQRQIDDFNEEIRLKGTEGEDAETGSFVRTRAMRLATPETYRNVFDLDINGQRVIEHLQRTFANKSTYVRGGQDAERESCFKAGQAHVIGFIFNQINKANDPNYKEEVND